MSRTEEGRSQDRNAAIPNIINLEQFSAPLTDEEIPLWHQLTHTSVSIQDQFNLLTDPNALSGIQGRLMQIFTVPNFSQLSSSILDEDTQYIWYVKTNNHASYSHLIKNWVPYLRGDQAVYAATLISTYLRQVSTSLEQGERPKNYWQSYEAQLGEYNKAILMLLSKLPPQEAEKLFNAYRLEIPKSPNEKTGDWDYNPVDYLLESTVAEQWKKEGVERLKGIIAKQLEDPNLEPSSSPALRRLIYVTQSLATDPKQRVGDDFILNTFDYLLKVHGNNRIHLPDQDASTIDKLYRILHLDPKTGYAFVMNQLFGESSYRFQVDSSYSEHVARLILDLYPKDRHIQVLLTEQLEQYRMVKIQEKNQESLENQKKRNFLKSLRKPDPTE